MFGKHTTSIYFLLFFLSEGSVILDAGHTQAFPDLRPTDNPLIHRDDPIPPYKEPLLSKDEEPILLWCAPIGLGLENIEPENNEVDNSSDTARYNSQESPNDCIPVFEDGKNLEN